MFALIAAMKIYIVVFREMQVLDQFLFLIFFNKYLLSMC